MMAAALCLCLFLWVSPVYAAQTNGVENPEMDIQKLLTSQEKDWLSLHPIIRMAGPRAFPPFHYYNADGTLQGMAADYISFVFDKLGVQLKIQPNLSWLQVLDGAQNKAIDLIACSAKTVDRQAYLEFTNPYLSFPLVIIARANAPFMGGLQDLHGKKVAFVKGAAAFEWISGKNISVTPYFVKTPLEALEAVSFGQAEAHIDNLAAATYLIQTQGMNNLKIAAPAASENYHLHMAVRKDWHPLVLIINKILDNMPQQRTMDIRNRWLAVNNDTVVARTTVMKWFVGLLCVVTLIFFIILLWNRRLGREVKERQLAQKALLDSQYELSQRTDMLSSIFETAAEGICVCFNIDEFPFVSFSHWNCKMEVLTGYTMAEINKLGWYQALYPDEELRKKAIARMVAMRQGDNISNEAWEIVTKNGTKKQVRISTSILKATEGRVFVLAIMHDITDQKRHEAALVSSRKKWENIFNAVGHPAMILDRNHRIEIANLATLKLTGLTQHQIKGKTCHVLFHGSAHPPNCCPMKALLDNGTAETVEMTMETLNGHFLVSCTPVLDEDGKIDKIIHIATDITEKIQLEHQLRQSHKMEAVGTLSGGMAHEFNNILGIILGNVELAMEDIPKGNSSHTFLSEVRKASLRGRDVVRQLLSFSRKTSHKKKIVDMRSCVQETIKLLRASIPTQIQFSENITSRNHTIMADQTQIQQMVINLCNNAAHAMEDNGGILEIGLHNQTITQPESYLGQILEPGQYLQLTVSDTGHGISHDIIEHVFDPFFTTKAVDKGTGMGLAVVHGIVNGHDGFIKINSEPGQGTTFFVYFPITEVFPHAVEKADSVFPTGTETILLVDDESAMVKMNCLRLQRLGYKVEISTDPEEALEMFKAHPHNFNLVITDMSMPRMTGEQLIRAMMDIEPDIKTIICTGYSKKLDKKSALEMGACDYIMKPMDLSRLGVTVRNVLDTPPPSKRIPLRP